MLVSKTLPSAYRFVPLTRRVALALALASTASQLRTITLPNLDKHDFIKFAMRNRHLGLDVGLPPC
jgi:hypothetical protein